MKFFNGLFKSNDNTSNSDSKSLAWHNLTQIDELESIKSKSETKTQLIFKHSTRCGISRAVINEFERSYSLNENEADLYYLDLLNYRNVSNAIAEQFNVTHQSPQLLIIKNGQLVQHASHSDINNLKLTAI